MIIDPETHVIYRVLPREVIPHQPMTFRPSWHEFSGDLFVGEMKRRGRTTLLGNKLAVAGGVPTYSQAVDSIHRHTSFFSETEKEQFLGKNAAESMDSVLPDYEQVSLFRE